MIRCKWCNLKNEKYIEYHNKEWCKSNFEDKYLFEMLILESFQAGLSWECVLNKREDFRKAFDNFDIEKICNYNDEKIHELLKNEKSLNFIGNVEPRDITSGDTNVLVCDGFTGNTVLKMYEGTASTVLNIIKDGMLSSGFTAKIGALLLKPVFKDIKKKFDYKEYGGAPFLGVDGICIKAHGSSDGKAFKNAIRQSKQFYDNKVLDKIKEQLELRA